MFHLSSTDQVCAVPVVDSVLLKYVIKLLLTCVNVKYNSGLDVSETSRSHVYSHHDVLLWNLS